ncbi:MAG: hypothetical protein JRM80_03855 [Nitrososphaerota archaeon]|nr:hypothetical protein [Nitrososphaerota archaeon]
MSDGRLYMKTQAASPRPAANTAPPESLTAGCESSAGNLSKLTTASEIS